MNNFTHINLHTEYSIIDGIIKIEKLVNYYKLIKINSICVTDIANISAFPEYYYHCLKNNIKPLVGIELFLIYYDKVIPIIILGKNFFGYLKLMEITSNCWRYSNLDNGVFVTKNWLINNFKNIIIILNLRYIFLDVLLKKEEVIIFLKELKLFFSDDIYIEISKINLPFEKYINKKIIYVAEFLKINMAATNSVKFMFKDEFNASLSKVLISQDIEFDDSLFFDYSEHQYIKTFNEMSYVFNNFKKPLLNTLDIINKCNLNFNIYKLNLPKINLKKYKIRKKVFHLLLKNGLKKRLSKKKKNVFHYLNRINKELIIINYLSLIDYFLVITEFMHWVKKNKIASGPGRGSGSSSLICYCLYICDLDPINENLSFERFFTSERIGVPDLDLDFCAIERDIIVDHIFDYYNYRNVSQIVTFHGLSVKTSVRDVGKSLGIDYSFGDRLSKSIPFSLTLSMEKIFRANLSVRRYISTNKKGFDIWKISAQIEGMFRNISKHSGGVIISNIGVNKHSPILFDEDEVLTHYEKIILQDIGLIKFDFLGLKTISIIGLALNMLPEEYSKYFIIDDFHTIQLINYGDTELVFQLDSYGMKKLIKYHFVENVFDLINLLSLFRPGPIQSGLIDEFVNRKHNLRICYYPYKELNYIWSYPALIFTHGVILFQEQIFQLILIYFECDNFSGEKVYNAMLYKHKTLSYLKIFFVKKCSRFKINKKDSEFFFNLIERFASYSFNKTHAHSYSKIVYQTAYLKSNFLLEFCIANILVDQLLAFDLNKVLMDVKSSGVIIYPPDINISQENFKVYKLGIVYGFSIINFIDEVFIDKILYYRNKLFYYNNFEVFCKIFSIFKIRNKKIIENLIFSGFFDCFRINRIILFMNFQFIYEKINLLLKEYNRAIIYKFLNYIDYTNIYSLKKKFLFYSPTNLLTLEKKILKIYSTILPSYFFFLRLLGHNNFNNLNRFEQKKINFTVAVAKKQHFFDRNKKTFKVYNEKIFFFYKISKILSLPKNDMSLFMVFSNINKKKFLIFRTRPDKLLNNFNSLIFLFIKKNNVLNLLKNIINLFTFLGSKIYFCIKTKNKILYFDTKITININESFYNFLNSIGIKQFFLLQLI
ncbi:DNA polymerase III alpha subunit [Candidatus Carsonella ruddii CS isolate Thao2000]|uniref:DNA polymerase III subunit alpha n=1 Tax=Candidatus Carsonella ruddii CS isolate Thao2000 TaxID=1202537 RepID=J7GW83_CARRU|nr:DNA polymerase III subunit alpha [Candidatus Carsonella ruddii]AFP83686.1 DNA polymerase III alpha subunit [Candidatus Carsonella ruddii CS isolate Thao2000]